MEGAIQNILLSVAGGLITAGILAAITLYLNSTRESLVYEKLLKSLTWPSLNRHINGIGIGVRNRTPLYIIVRGVQLEMDHQIMLTLNFHEMTGAVGWNYNDAEEDDIPDFLRFTASIDSVPDSRFKILAPYTEAVWLIPNRGVATLPVEFTRCDLLVEYPTIFGGRRLLKISADQENMRVFNKIAKEHREWLLEKGNPKK